MPKSSLKGSLNNSNRFTAWSRQWKKNQ